VSNSPVNSVLWAGLFLKLFPNLLNPQVRPPLPHKLPLSSIHEISGSKLKFEEEDEEEADYVSETPIFDSSPYSNRKH
jgi:hypothetical protein